MEHFSDNPHPNRTCTFQCIRLSSDTFSRYVSRLSVMDSHVTVSADYQGLSPAGRHVLDPGRTFPPTLFLQVSEFADVMHLDLLGTPTEFAFVREQPLEQLAAAKPDSRPWVLVLERA